MKFKYIYFVLLFLSFNFSAFSQMVTLDNTFGTGGKVLYSFALNGDALNAIAIQQDEKILVCTLKEFSLNGNIMVSRFNTDGTLDTNFGINGIVETQLVSETGGNNLMKLQNDGKILITGSKSINSNSDFFDFATMRFNSNGSIDTFFGTNGIVITDLNGKGDFATAVSLQSDNKIIVAGYTFLNINQNARVSLVRYLSDGAIDTTFGTNGKLLLPLLSSNSYDYTNCIKVLSNDSIVIGASTTALETLEDYSNFGILKVNNNGTIDTAFGSNGGVVADFGAKESIGAIEEYNGKIVASGYSRFTGGSKIAIAKYEANGTLDTSFGVNGIFYGNRNGTNPYDAIAGMKVLNDGKMLCTGYTLNNTDADFLLIKFNVDGTIDNGFNNVGYFMTDFNNNTNDVSGAIDIGADGKIVCAGLTDLNAIRITSIARYNLNELSNASFSDKSISVYPNPFMESITIESKKINLSNATIELYDISGRKFSNFIAVNASNFTLQMDKKLSKGNYFLKISNEGKTETIKIIKQ